MKVTQIGIIEQIGQVVTKNTGSKTYNQQSVILLVPGYTNEFGEKVGKDEYWEFNLYGNAITNQALATKFKPGDKVTIDGYLNSRAFKVQPSGVYTYELRLAECKPYVRAQ